MRKLIDSIKRWWLRFTAATVTHKVRVTPNGNVFIKDELENTPNWESWWAANGIKTSQWYLVSNSPIAGASMLERVNHEHPSKTYYAADAGAVGEDYYRPLYFCKERFCRYFPVIPETLWVKEVGDE